MHGGELISALQHGPTQTNRAITLAITPPAISPSSCRNTNGSKDRSSAASTARALARKRSHPALAIHSGCFSTTSQSSRMTRSLDLSSNASSTFPSTGRGRVPPCARRVFSSSRTRRAKTPDSSLAIFTDTRLTSVASAAKSKFCVRW